MPSFQRKILTKLRQILARRFDAGELHTLCFDLDINYEDLAGGTREEKARELISYLDRRNRLQDLIDVGKTTRSDINCEQLFQVEPMNQSREQSKIVYFSDDINNELDTWAIYSNIETYARRANFYRTLSEEKTIFELRTFSNEHVGFNKSLDITHGQVEFNYKIVYSHTSSLNVAFYIIPMQEVWTETAGIIEIESSQPFGNRVLYNIPNEHIGDDHWHFAKMSFDFRKIEQVTLSIFAPRINEGCVEAGSAYILFSELKVTLTE